MHEVVLSVYKNLDEFIRWPKKAMLLWQGCDRSKKYHAYPPSIKFVANRKSIGLDGRVNGPAVTAFQIAGGDRPSRYGSKNAWSVHHLYSGKFPYVGKADSLHACKDGNHCTQSAGLVAVHPITDQMCDEYPFFTWLLRAKAFQKFRYDPDNVFSDGMHDELGFTGRGCYLFPLGQTAT